MTDKTRLSAEEAARLIAETLETSWGADNVGVEAVIKIVQEQRAQAAEEWRERGQKLLADNDEHWKRHHEAQTLIKQQQSQITALRAAIVNVTPLNTRDASIPGETILTHLISKEQAEQVYAAIANTEATAQAHDARVREAERERVEDRINQLVGFIFAYTNCDCPPVDYKPDCARHNVLYPVQKLSEKEG